MLKKSLATVLATFATMNGFSTFFIVSTIAISNPLLTSPATAADPDYSAAIKYLNSNQNLVGQVVSKVWNNGGKAIAAQKIAETLNGKQLRKGVSIYGAEINLNNIQPSGVQLLNDGRQATVRIAVPVSNVNFKTTTPSIFGSYADPSFRVKFNLNAVLQISANRQITVDNIAIIVSDASISGSNLTGTLVETFADFFTKGRFSQDIVSRINANYSFKGQLASYIQSAVGEFTPSNILTGQTAQPLVTNNSEEQTLTASCTSTGQVCDNSAIFNVRPSNNRSLIVLTAPATHCSAVSYEVVQPGFSTQKTQFLQPGQERSFPVNLSKGSDYQFTIRAIGINGGCNTGRLVSWSAKVRLDN